MKILLWLQKNLIIVIPLTMLTGFIYGSYGTPESLKSFIIPVTFLMIYPMMINLQIKKVLGKDDLQLQLTTQIINFLIIPFIAFSLGKLFLADQPLLFIGLLFIALLPSSGMTVSWTAMARGNLTSAVKMVILGLLPGTLLAPFYLKLLAGAAIAINLTAVFKQILLILLLPMLLGQITRYFLIKKTGIEQYQQRIKKNISAFSIPGVIGIVFVAMALKAKMILAHPLILLKIALPLTLFYLLITLTAIVIGKRFFQRKDGIALLYGTVMRNLSIALALAITTFGPEGSEIALVITLSYIIQIQLATWLMKLVDKIFHRDPGHPPPSLYQSLMP